MVLPSHAVAPGDGWLAKQIAELRAEVQGLKSSMAGQEVMAKEIEFFKNQRAFSERGGVDTAFPSGATNLAWLPFDAAVDASVDVDIDDGMSVVVAAWLKNVSCELSDCGIAMAVEVLKDGELLYPYSATEFAAAGYVSAGESFKNIPMPENQSRLGRFGAGQYSFRMRRGYSSSGAAELYFLGSTLSITKVHP